MHPFDPTSTQLRPLAEYSERLPSSRRGRKLHRSTLCRWMRGGVRGGIVLQTTRLGGCRYTCDAWVAEFMRAASAADSLPHPRRSLPAEEQDRIRREFDVPANVAPQSPANETK
jgi:hypothetical protein